jgi:hypothetical protein
MASHRCFDLVAAQTDDPPARFRELCAMHDTSYDFSDDHTVWRRGETQFATLRRYVREHLTPAQAKAIWNDVVRTKFTTDRGQQPFLIPDDKDWS